MASAAVLLDSRHVRGDVCVLVWLFDVSFTVLMQRAGQVSGKAARTSKISGGKKAAYSFVCSLSGEVGQKVPEVMDAWLQNLCARLCPRVAD